MLNHKHVEYSTHLANFLDFPIVPDSLLDNVHKDSAHVKLFLMKLCYDDHNSMVLPIVILEKKTYLFSPPVLIWN
jgi:hypothetical protein